MRDTRVHSETRILSSLSNKWKESRGDKGETHALLRTAMCGNRESDQCHERGELETAKGAKNNFTLNLVSQGNLFPNIETCINSYFCRPVKDWNALPYKIVSIECAKQFKQALSEHFNYSH